MVDEEEKRERKRDAPSNVQLAVEVHSMLPVAKVDLTFFGCAPSRTGRREISRRISRLCHIAEKRAHVTLCTVFLLVDWSLAREDATPLLPALWMLNEFLMLVARCWQQVLPDIYVVCKTNPQETFL